MTAEEAKEIKELNRKLDLIMAHLAIGKAPPVTVMSLKNRAKETAQKLNDKSGKIVQFSKEG